MAQQNGTSRLSQVRKSQSRGLTQQSSQRELYAELQVKNEQVDKLSCQLIDQEMEMAPLRELKSKLDKLKQLEVQLDEKDKKIAELSKQVMMQEGAIQGWLDTIETKKQIIKDKEKRLDQLEAENGALVSKNAESNKKIKKLELELADANAKIREKDGEILAHRRLNESLAAQKSEIERQLRKDEQADKYKDERI